MFLGESVDVWDKKRCMSASVDCARPKNCARVDFCAAFPATGAHAAAQAQVRGHVPPAAGVLRHAGMCGLRPLAGRAPGHGCLTPFSSAPAVRRKGLEASGAGLDSALEVLAGDEQPKGGFVPRGAGGDFGAHAGSGVPKGHDPAVQAASEVPQQPALPGATKP
jgi:hypothetical protein